MSSALSLFSQRLRSHMIRSTVTRSYTFVENDIVQAKTDNPKRIDPNEPYQLFIYKESADDDSTLKSETPLSPCFESFIQDGQKYMETASEQNQNKVCSVMEDYLILRRAAREESHILELNRVGIERDQKKQVENISKQVGLRMPKLYEKEGQ